MIWGGYSRSLTISPFDRAPVIHVCVFTHLVPFLRYSELKPNYITLAGSKLVADRFDAKFHYAIWFEAGRRPASNQLRTSLESASNQLRTSSEPARVMEFGF